VGEFRRRYFRELAGHADALEPIIKAVHHGPVTLVYSSHDTEYNNAVALKDYSSMIIGLVPYRARRRRSGADRCRENITAISCEYLSPL
jgi:hypothetical protein